MPAPSLSVGSPTTQALPDRLDAIFRLIHQDQPADAELCWLIAPDAECDHVELAWLPAFKILIAPSENVEAAIVAALRELAKSVNTAADRVERGGR